MIARMSALAASQVVLGCVALVSLSAADHDNLEEHLPITVQDAYPLPFGAIEAQLAAGYQKPKNGDDAFALMPRLEYGLAPNLQASVATTIITDGDRQGSGDITVGALYDFNQETVFVPAIAVAADVDLPTGEDSHGVGGVAWLLMTKGPVPSSSDRLHLNLGWEWLGDSEGDERDGRFIGVLGWSRPLGTDTVLVLDVVRRESETYGLPWETAAEMGLRRQLTPLAVGSLGVGADWDDDTGYTGFRLTAGLQRSF